MAPALKPSSLPSDPYNEMTGAPAADTHFINNALEALPVNNELLSENKKIEEEFKIALNLAFKKYEFKKWTLGKWSERFMYLLPFGVAVAGPVSGAATGLSVIAHSLNVMLTSALTLSSISVGLAAILILTTYWYKKYLDTELDKLKNKIDTLDAELTKVVTHNEAQKKLLRNKVNFWLLKNPNANKEAIRLLIAQLQDKQQNSAGLPSTQNSSTSLPTSKKNSITQRISHYLLPLTSFLGVGSSAFGIFGVISLGLTTGLAGWVLLGACVALSILIFGSHSVYLRKTAAAEKHAEKLEEELRVAKAYAIELYNLEATLESITVSGLEKDKQVLFIRCLESLTQNATNKTTSASNSPETEDHSKKDILPDWVIPSVIFGAVVSGISSSMATALSCVETVAHLSSFSMTVFGGLVGGIGVISTLAMIFYHYHIKKELNSLDKKMGESNDEYEAQIKAKKQEEEELIILYKQLDPTQQGLDNDKILEKISGMNSILEKISKPLTLFSSKVPSHTKAKSQRNRLINYVTAFSGISLLTSIAGTVALFSLGIFTGPPGWAILALSIIAAVVFLVAHKRYMHTLDAKEHKLENLQSRVVVATDEHHQRLSQKCALKKIIAFKEKRASLPQEVPDTIETNQNIKVSDSSLPAQSEPAPIAEVLISHEKGNLDTLSWEQTYYHSPSAR